MGLAILASDKVHLNNCYGDKQCYGVYLSCGNIKSSIRFKTSARCWMMVAQIPVAKFDQKDFQGILAQRLYHQCMDIITQSLKECSHNPQKMTDATGTMRLVRTILWAHLADYPEQQLIACVSGSCSPVTFANYKSFGFQVLRQRRTGVGTMQHIRTLLKTKNLTTTQFARYATLAKKKGLNGVFKPFWRDWKYADPNVFLVPDALHQWHRFFYDHLMSWARILMGDREVDARYSRLQKHIGYRHFVNGFTSHSQHTGREHRDLQRHFMAIIAGHETMTDPILIAFRSLVEFLYAAQSANQSEKKLAFMERSLRTFHEHKKAISATGVRNGKYKKGQFHIKKLELLLNVSPSIRKVGSSPQYSTDQSEVLHKFMAKIPYLTTNKKDDYETQMCRFVDRQEKVDLLFLFIEYMKIRKSKEAKKDSEGDPTRAQEPAAPTPAAKVPAQGSSAPTSESKVPANELAKKFLPPAIRSAFDREEEFTPRNVTTAFLLTDRVANGKMNIREVEEMYHLPRLRQLLHGLFGKDKFLLDCWPRVRLQMRSVCEPDVVLPPVVVMAEPPSTDHIRGLCNFVLVKGASTYNIAGIKGMRTHIDPVTDIHTNPTSGDHFVAQVRLVFNPLFESRKPTLKNEYFAYLQPLEPPQHSLRDGVHVPDKGIGLYRVMRSHAADRTRNGLIVNLKDIWRPIDLVPKFGKKCPRKWNSSTSCEVAMEFFVNHFFDKETFETFTFH